MSFHPSVRAALEGLQERWAGVPLAAFGQTVFWDEPTKGVLLPMLEAYYPDAELMVGPHDADYFGKGPVLPDSPGFAILERNDGPTRDMWASVGEVSALFGAEIVPTRALLSAAGVNLQRLESSRYARLVRRRTTAAGWRAIVETTRNGVVFRDVKTAEVLPLLLELLSWALEETLARIDCPRSPQHRARADALLRLVRETAAAPGHERLAELYRDLWPAMYRQVAGVEDGRLRLTTTCEVFRFNRSTCHLPRFRLLDLFLNPKTAPACKEAYSLSLVGSGIYDLDRFGSEAIPFDLVVPGRGRGTITPAHGHLLIHTHPHIVIDVPRRIESAMELAEVVEGALGPEVALVGKAVALAYMITSEYVFVLNQGGSPYVSRTREMARRLSEKGICCPLNPVLRLHYPTWDALRASDVRLRLDPDMAAAFGARSLSARQFAASWRDVVRRERRLLHRLGRIRRPVELMELLSRHGHAEWIQRAQQAREANETLLRIQSAVTASKTVAYNLRQETKALRAEVDALQRKRGELSRRIKSYSARLCRASMTEMSSCPSGVNTGCEEDAVREREAVDSRLKALRCRIRKLEMERRAETMSYRTLETGEEARHARCTMRRLGMRAEAARLLLASRAVRVGEGLSYTHCRPTAWWFEVVDPERGWLEAFVDGTQLSIEEML